MFTVDKVKHIKTRADLIQFKAKEQAELSEFGKIALKLLKIRNILTPQEIKYYISGDVYPFHPL